MENRIIKNKDVQNTYKNNDLILPEEVLLYKKYHDVLTGLKNRLFYEDELQRINKLKNLPITMGLSPFL